jgi:hypothetical protein
MVLEKFMNKYIKRNRIKILEYCERDSKNNIKHDIYIYIYFYSSIYFLNYISVFTINFLKFLYEISLHIWSLNN